MPGSSDPTPPTPKPDPKSFIGRPKRDALPPTLSPEKRRQLHAMAVTVFARRQDVADVRALVRSTTKLEAAPASIIAGQLVEVGYPELGLEPLRSLMAARLRETVANAERIDNESQAIDAASAARTLEAKRAATLKAEQGTKAAIGDALEQKLEEAKLVRANRRSSMVLTSMNAELLAAGMVLVKRVRTDIETGAAMSPKQSLDMLRDIASIVKSTAESSRIAVQLDRLILGEPTAILEHKTNAAPADMTPAQANEWLEVATRHLQRQARKATTVDVDGEE